MLSRLSIRDIVLIDRLDIDFAPGLSVLTGETGAGKSILLDAFGLAVDGLPSATELVFVGKGPLSEALAARAERSPARDRIRFVGEIVDSDAT